VHAGPRAPGGPPAPALARCTARVLDALGVVCGPATTRLAYGDDDTAGSGPRLVCALAAPVMTRADEAPCPATGRHRASGVPDCWPAPAVPFFRDRS
ncbi:hypothetical protein ABT404_01055, partial [Streptomyces hyaluromycini]